MKIWSRLTVIASIVGFGLSWNDTGLSNCAKNCLNNGLQLECAPRRIEHDECICKSSQLYSSVACCVMMYCQPEDQKAADTLVNNTCTAATVTLITDLRACVRPTDKSMPTNVLNYPSSGSTGGTAKDRNSQIIIIIVATLGAVVVCIGIVGAYIYCRRRHRARTRQKARETLQAPTHGIEMYPEPKFLTDYPPSFDSRMPKYPVSLELQTVSSQQASSSVLSIR